MKAQFLVLNTIALTLLGSALVGQERAIASTFSMQQANAQLIAQTSNARLTGGPWKGRWDGHDGYLFDFTMQLSADSNNRVTGNIQWTMLASPHSSHRAKIGLTAIEYVSGTYSPETRSVEMEGQSKDDPNGVISLDGYKISFNSDMSGLTGKSRNNGGWKGEMVGAANVSSSIALAAGVQEGAIAGDYRVSATASLIRKKTTVPVLLPSEDVVERNKFNPDETIYANVETASEYSEYQVDFNNQPGIVGRVALRFSIKAKRGGNIEQSTSFQGSKFQNAKLIDGSNAVVMTQCGAGCWSRVQWKLNGVLYEVWSKTRTPETALAIANSAVKAGDRSKPSVKSADNRSTQVDGQTGAVNLGGSSYFSWGLLKPESRDNSQPQIVMGYACQTQNQLQGISKRASVTRYVIKRGRGTDDWWLESLGGVAVIPTDSGYIPKKISGTSGNELKQYVTDSSSGWLKRDMDVDGLGNACLNGGIQSALKYIQDSVSNQPIAQQPTEPLQPIAAASTYAYPSPAEFAQFKKTLKPSPVALSTTDRKLRQDFQAEWQKKNRAIAPYIGAWKTADNQDVYVFPSTVSQRACVVRQKDGQLEMKLAVSMTADMRFDGNTGMFRVDPMTDVVAGRSDKSEPLSALYGAIGSPEVSASVREELVQAGCVSELPRGGAIAEKPDVKPIDTLIRTGAGSGAISSENNRCSKEIGLGSSFDFMVVGGRVEGALKPEIMPPEIDKNQRCIFLKSQADKNDSELLQRTIENQGDIWIVIHGWNNSSNDEIIRELAQKTSSALGENNLVLILDWSEAAYAKHSESSNRETDVIKQTNLIAGSWIRPVAEATVTRLRDLGVKDEYALQHLHLMGHSLGTLVSEQMGAIYKKGNQHGVKSIIALDPPSEAMGLGRYILSGIDKNAKPGSFQNATPLARAFVGNCSVAGNEAFTKTAHESFKFIFPGSTSCVDQHELVVKAFSRLISAKPFWKIDTRKSFLSLDDLEGNPFMKKQDGFSAKIFLSNDLNSTHLTFVNHQNESFFVGSNMGNMINANDEYRYYYGGSGDDSYSVSQCSVGGFTIRDSSGSNTIELSLPVYALGKVSVNSSEVKYYNSEFSKEFPCKFVVEGEATLKGHGVVDQQIKTYK
jgi:pimeloyl-ACP methyl ester carboxylesterase